MTDAGQTLIAQLSSTVVPESKLNVYVEQVKVTEIPRYEKAPGLISVSLLKKSFVAYVELLIISLWESEEALARFEKNEPVASHRGEDELNPDLGWIHIGCRTYDLLMSGEGVAGGIRPGPAEPGYAQEGDALSGSPESQPKAAPPAQQPPKA